MTEGNSLKNREDENSSTPPVFIINGTARSLLKEMEDILDGLICRADLHPSSEEFYNKFLRFLELQELFQRELLNETGVSTVCGAGCSSCCCHWVDDVYSFEGIIISRFIKEQRPWLVEPALSIFRRDAECMESLSVIVDDKLSELIPDPDEIPDRNELLLSCFYQMERPCALLDDTGRCSIYPVRPLTCRDYLNISAAEACLPERINEASEATLIMYLPDTLSEKLETLHCRFRAGVEDMSLRHILINLLEALPGDC